MPGDKESIGIRKKDTPKHKTTQERLIEFYGENYEKHYVEQKEIDWGTPVGDEIW
jgi:antitoxin component of MazEF toxin-antitoxin module